MIPDGWTETTLAEIADVIDCKHRTPSYADSGIPLISPGNISWGKLDLDNCKCVVHDDYVSLMDHCKVNLGDLVMGRNQSFGVASYVYDDRIFALGQDTILIKPKGCDSKFLYQIIQSPLFQEQINRLSSGSTFKRINLKDIRNLQILAPKLDCQIKIAEVLGVWDESIDLLERLIGRVRSRKQGLMQQLLTGKKRFKEFEGSEWKTVKLGDVCKFIRDGTHGTHERLEDGIPLLSATNITKSGQVCFDNASLISKEDYDKIHTKYEIQDRDFLLTVVGTLGRSAIVENLPKFTLQRSVAIVRVDESKINPIYLYCFSKSSEFQVQLKNRANITAQAGVYLGELGKITLKLPSLPEQEKIAAVLSAADEEISTLEKQLAAYKQQKLGLMQQLLTGKIRVGMI
jgi:type I restriction enzyme, S subunit